MAERLQSIRLPDAQEIEVFLVRLDDGTVVARTKQELEAMERAAIPPKESAR